MYKAITDRIIVRLNDDCPQTKLLTLPNSAQRNTGTVVDIGPAVRDVQKGDEIIFRIYEELPLPQKNMAVIREKSVLGIIDKHNTTDGKENLCHNKTQ